MSAPERFVWQLGDVTIIRAGQQIAFARETKVVVGPYLAERDGRIVPVEGYAYFREGANIEYLDVPTHVADLSDPASLLWASEMRDQGVSIQHLADEVRSQLTPEFLDQGRVWYPEALDAAAQISKESGIDLDRIVTAIAVMSPRCQWEDPESGEGEKKYVLSLAKFIANGGTDGITADAVMDENGKPIFPAARKWKDHYKKTNTVLGLDPKTRERTGDPVGASVFDTNVAKAIRVLPG